MGGTIYKIHGLVHIKVLVTAFGLARYIIGKAGDNSLNNVIVVLLHHVTFCNWAVETQTLTLQTF